MDTLERDVTTPAQRARLRAEALRALIPQGQTVVYAFRLTDGTIKIGCTANLAKRRGPYRDAEIIGFRFGDHDDEQAIHDSLQASVVRGREYYHPTPDVLAVVNEMRADFNLPPLD